MLMTGLNMDPGMRPGAGGGFRNPMLAGLAALFFFLGGLVMWNYQGSRAYVYGAVREVIKTGTLLKIRHMERLEGRHFTVYYEDEDKKMASLVLDTAEKFYRPVVDQLGFIPKEKVPVIIYPTREALGQTFGWEADESAMGVYWAGVIRVLSPQQWVDADEPGEMRRTFETTGPMAHEFIHLVVDYRTKGNYPRWFTEGVAQYEEFKLTGFLFREPGSRLDQPLYPFSEMDADFDYLPNQSLAYRQSLVTVQYLIKEYGSAKLDNILTNLGRGMSLNRSFKEAIGVDVNGFEQDFHIWLRENMDEANLQAS
ncbi:MAG: peptidase MA family metallohydrolase [Thermincolia bacterium]